MNRSVLSALALICAMASAHAQNYSPDDLAHRTMERRAVEAVIWGMPAVNTDLMYKAMVRETKGAFNQIVYWSRLPDWKNQTLTPNPDAIYLMPFFNTKDVGPVVLEIPPADDGSITGNIVDVWQAALEDVGPAGVDKGKGGKILILPPGYKDKAPDGYIALPSETYQGYALLRSILRGGSDANVAKAVAYGRRVKLYPLSQAASPPPTIFVDAIDVVFDSTFIGIKHPGTGQYYLMTIKDKQGRAFDGGSTYRLTVPANVPVRQYWSATAYDRATHAFIRNLPRSSRSSQNPDLQKNADGSVDIYFGPKAPAGKQSNWVPTSAKGQFEVLFRFYGPEPYSSAVFDLDGGPVTVVLPDAGERFMSLIVIDEDHYVHAVYYGAGRHTLRRDDIGTRYVFAAVRTLVDPGDAKDVTQVHALQDAIKVSQKSPGRFEVPNWDPASEKKVHDALLVLAATIPDFKKAFGTKDQVDPVRHLIGTAAAWGGNPDKEATYLNVTPGKNDGTTVYRLIVKDVPVNGFWSVSVYNAEGYFQKNEYSAYTLNNITAKKNGDGSIVIQFGGCDGKVVNCLPIVPGWNYTVRLYRPRAEILNGKWTFPQAQPVR
jgi:hypothetical protein